MFEKGDSITLASLTKVFRKMFQKVNEITSLNVKALTTAQFLDIFTANQTTVVVRPMSVSSEQYFDTTYIAPYSVGFDSDVASGDWSYMKFYLDEISKLEEIHGR